MASSIRDLLRMELQDTYSAETQGLGILPEMREVATSPRLKRIFEEHAGATRQQVERLEEVCRRLGIEPEGNTCEAMEGLVEEAEEIMDELDEGAVLDAALVGAARKIEHYEMAAYGTLTCMLRAMGETEAASLLARTLGEERGMDEALTEVAEAEVHPAALRRAANDQARGSRGAA